MKPTKNRYKCHESGQVKMLFPTKEKAERFIKFNAKDIWSYGKPLRAYYCPACFGWHITHHEFKAFYEGRTERIVEMYRRERASQRRALKEKSVEASENYPIQRDKVKNRLRALEIFNEIPLEIRQGKWELLKQYIKENYEEEDNAIIGTVYNYCKNEKVRE